MECCVVGAGIIGLSVATHLLETFPDQLKVTVVADRFTPDTLASDRTGGLVVPPRTHYPCPDLETASRWISATLRHFERVIKEAGGENTGVTCADGYYAAPPSQKIWWDNIVPNFREVSITDLAKTGISLEGENVYGFTSYIVNGKEYLIWLSNKFCSLGGLMYKRLVHSLTELSSYDFVINCSGLGARELVNDPTVFPLKGHLISVRAPWVKEWVHCRTAYIYTRGQEIVLGTTAEVGKENLDVCNDCKQEILSNCSQVMPSLEDPEIINCWAGIRPMREGGVRLEMLKNSMGVGKPEQVVVHCYGHGPFGVTLSWGCAEDVGNIIGKTFGLCVLNSKL